ncbi:methyltransferase [Balneolales bacterium ANBcel1]|nr:methyltransferase [Balneolales bacterium ANBcel1]
MSKIAYDPTKDRFAAWIRRSRSLRTLFYRLLDMFFLRSWYVRSAVRAQFRAGLSRRERVDILDAGSGFGQYDRFLLTSFPNAVVHAADIKEDYLDDCRYYFRDAIASGRIRFDAVDLVTQELPAESYDLALCVDVLEHIEDDIGVMKRIRKALKPGGMFVMHSPSHYSEEDAGEDEFFVDEHARAGYSREELLEKLMASGLEPVSVRYTYGKWGHRAWVMLIKYPMLWFTRFGMKTMFWLPFYYAVTLLPGLAMMAVDGRRENPRGTGIIGVSSKR